MRLVVPIVEGHGEVEAVPVLIRRIGSEFADKTVVVNPPFRVRSSSFLKFDDDFQKAIRFCSLKAKSEGGIVLILLDSEDHCPATLGPQIAEQASKIRSDVTFLVCLAHREFETWFIFAASSLAGYQGLPDNLVPLNNPEAIRDAKGWFGKQLPRGYKETQHQVSLAATMDLGQASESKSFKRLVERLVPLL